MAAAVALPLAALALPASGITVKAAGETAVTAADSTACPWLNQALPVQQWVSMLMAQMTLANKFNMVAGGWSILPSVFEIPAIRSLCIPAMGEEDGPLGVG